MTNLALRPALTAFTTSRLLRTAVFAAAISLLAPFALAQAPTVRIAGDIAGNARTAVPNSAVPRANPRFDAGRLAGSTRLQGISIYFNRTQAQEASLKELLADQQNPASPLYHHWLTPDQFAARFGMADTDLAKVQSWLEEQGFSVDSVNRSKNMIRFSGTAAQVESAFATEMHSYNVPTAQGIEKHFAPSTALSVPSAIAGIVQGVRNLDDFRPHSHLARKNSRPKPKFTWDNEGSQYLYFAPGDIATVYDITKEYNSSYTGTGQTITIVGQSEISNTDLQNFWSAAGITRQNPTANLVADSGDPTVYADGDEAESDLDLEWAGAIAKGASLEFVYVGNNGNYSAFDSIEYAIDQQIGTIISSSYGDCETDIGSGNIQTLEGVLEQASAQGQTLMSAAGDDGSTDCYEDTSLTTTQQQALAVDYPASSPNITGVGGTEISQASATYETAPSAYWTGGTTSEPVITTSALQYIPEQAWNEDENFCLLYLNEGYGGSPVCSGGGGASAVFTTKPSWQAGVPGIPTDGKRDVPDLALAAAIYNPGYLFCTSDSSFWDTSDGQASSCGSGSFFDSTDQFLTGGGGTSFATPIFAGMLALINQQQGYTTGQGLINPTLYTLASNSTTYASAFHDITSGTNACQAGSGYCSASGASGFAAGTGYDQATGLGSVDLFNLAAAWPANSGSSSGLIGTTTTVSATSTTPSLNTNDTFTITVASVTGTTIPTGTVNITVDDNTPVSGTLTANGTYTYTTSFSVAGTHTVAVSYPSNATYAGSTGSVTVTVPTPVSGTGSFTLSATNVTVAQGSVGTSTVTVTPSGGYTGTVDFNLSATSNDLQNVCPTLNNISVSTTAAVTGTLTIDTNAANCDSTGAARKGKRQVIHAAGFGSGRPGPITAVGILAGLLLAGWLGRSSRKFRVLAGVILLATLGLAFTGCGGNNNGTTVANAPKGTYTITLSGEDTSSSSITATTTFTLTID